MPNYTIEARSLDIGGVASHDFWVLRDGNGKALSELHGLATDRKTNTPSPIGTDEERYSLRVWHLPRDPDFARTAGEPVAKFSYIAAEQSHRTIFSGPKEEVLARWNAAVAAKEPLNSLDIDYPNYGFKVFGDTVNSNSAYRTLGEIMGLPIKDFPGVAEPGIDNRMTTPAQIEALRVRGYPVLQNPSIMENGQYKALPERLDPAKPSHPDHTLYQQALYGLHQADSKLGREPDETSLRMAASLTLLAKESGMQRIDHVVLSRANEYVKEGENVFVVEGKLDDPAHSRAHMKTQMAVETSAAHSFRQMQTLNEGQQPDHPQHDLVASLDFQNRATPAHRLT